MAHQPDHRIGTVLGGFRIEALVGRGGMGVVYLAEQLKFGRRVALKVLPPELAEAPGYRQRFEQEWRTAAALEHPNIVPIYDAGEAEGVLYIAMRYVEGVDLTALIAGGGRLEADRALVILDQVGAALDAAHAHGLVHRDVKPGNILIARRLGLGAEHVYLTDFGVAKGTRAGGGLTKTGFFVGSIDYASPEQIEGRPVDGRADVYSLGCVLYQCLTGSLPFEKDSDVSLLYAHLMEPVPPPSERRPDLPPELDAVIRKALAKAREDRYESCRELIAAARAAFGTAAPAAASQNRTVVSTPPSAVDRAGTGALAREQPLAAGTLQAPGAVPTTPAAPPPVDIPGPTPAGLPETPPRKPWWRSRVALAVAAAVALAGGGAGAAIALSGGGSDEAVAGTTLTTIGGGGEATTSEAATSSEAATTSPPATTSAPATTEQVTTVEQTTTDEATSIGGAYPNRREDKILAYVSAEAQGSPTCERGLAADRPASATAAVVCSRGKVSVFYELFPSRAALDRRYTGILNRSGVTPNTGTCPALSDQSWHYTGTPDVDRGQLLCWTAGDGRAVVTWTVYGRRILASAVRPDANHSAIYNWWVRNV
jgi:serine/threonine-protein kinase